MNNMEIYLHSIIYYEHLLMWFNKIIYIYIFKININQTLEVKNSPRIHLLSCLILTKTSGCSYFDAHLQMRKLRLQWGKRTCSRSQPAHGRIGYKLGFSSAFSTTPPLPLRYNSRFHFSQTMTNL